ncbi:hypothetical protein [Kitasatospora sp. NPDC057500]|uniref:hypothetical protein n=1 Tax=Kitasatospora sp. NPDC057500 TaxID=3346151 RepID=UPI003692AA28
MTTDHRPGVHREAVLTGSTPEGWALFEPGPSALWCSCGAELGDRLTSEQLVPTFDAHLVEVGAKAGSSLSDF